MEQRVVSQPIRRSEELAEKGIVRGHGYSGGEEGVSDQSHARWSQAEPTI
jgi:6-phosphogluconate dehydrogenase